jgi:hypothetical protein
VRREEGGEGGREGRRGGREGGEGPAVSAWMFECERGGRREGGKNKLRPCGRSSHPRRQDQRPCGRVGSAQT